MHRHNSCFILWRYSYTLERGCLYVRLVYCVSVVVVREQGVGDKSICISFVMENLKILKHPFFSKTWESILVLKLCFIFLIFFSVSSKTPGEVSKDFLTLKVELKKTILFKDIDTQCCNIQLL